VSFGARVVTAAVSPNAFVACVAAPAAASSCGARVRTLGGVQPTVIRDGHAVAFGIGRVAATAAARRRIVRVVSDADAARQFISVSTVSTFRLFSHRFAPCSDVKRCDPAREVFALEFLRD
jgi:hypothetical protein